LSNIRVNYSGLLSLVFGLVSTAIGMIFILIVTRTLTIIEYGTWNLIIGFTIYAIVIEPIISVWVLREVAKDQNSGRTAVLSGLLFSIGGMLIYLLTVFLIADQTDAKNDLLLFGIILIPLIFINRIFTAINSGWKPHAVGYGQLSFSITEVIFAIFFIYYLDWGIFGLILTVALGYLVSIFLQAYVARFKLRNKFSFIFLKKWLKLFWLSLYPTFASMIAFFDVTIFAIITGSVEGLAYWGASLAISSIIINVGLLTRSTYSKLLESKDQLFLPENIRILFYLGIPFVGLVIIISEPGLFLLNPLYQIAFPIVIIMSIQVFLGLLNRNFQELLTGIERVDNFEHSTISDFIHSKLFQMPTLRLLKHISYIVLLTVGLSLVATNTSSIELVFLWSIIALLIEIPFTIYSIILVKKYLNLDFQVWLILKYICISFLIFGITYLLIENYLIDLDSTTNFIFIALYLLPFIVFSCGAYLLLTYAVDKKTKKFIKAIFNEIF
jgi:O-antigen/teichoic acid export membrane protein